MKLTKGSAPEQGSGKAPHEGVRKNRACDTKFSGKHGTGSNSGKKLDGRKTVASHTPGV